MLTKISFLAFTTSFLASLLVQTYATLSSPSLVTSHFACNFFKILYSWKTILLVCLTTPVSFPSSALYISEIQKKLLLEDIVWDFISELPVKILILFANLSLYKNTTELNASYPICDYPPPVYLKVLWTSTMWIYNHMNCDF